MKNIYTDLALETREYYQEKNKTEPDGVIYEEYNKNDVQIAKVEIVNSEGAKNLGKPIGKYITLTLPKHKDYSKLIDDSSEILKDVLRELIGINTDETVLVVGLGNLSVTPDSLGPKVINNIEVTRHMFELIPEQLQNGIRPVCSLSPGVLGTTGIETKEIIKGTVEKVNPTKIIAIDALASRKLDRIATTIQISNTGISPGAGIGNHRKILDRHTLGVPVIAIGVPTVVSASTLIADLCPESSFSQNKDNDDIIVTPKDIDEVINLNAEIISQGINSALHNVQV